MSLLQHRPATPATNRFEEKLARPFILRSVSEATRATYTRALREFFLFVGNIHPTAVKVAHVLRFRDDLIRLKRRPATVALKLSVLRSFFDYLKSAGLVEVNPAASKLVEPPVVSDESPGRALAVKEVRYLLSGPDRSKPAGARDYAMLLMMVRLALRVGTVCSLRVSSIKWGRDRWILRAKIKGGKEVAWPLPQEVKDAVDEYLKLDRARREIQHTDGDEAFLFQPLVNYRTLVFGRALTTRSAWKIVRRWADYSGIGEVSPHDLRHTAITRAFEKGSTIRQVQMMSKHRDLRNLQRYDHDRENMEQNAVNVIDYEDEI